MLKAIQCHTRFWGLLRLGDACWRATTPVSCMLCASRPGTGVEGKRNQHEQSTEDSYPRYERFRGKENFLLLILQRHGEVTTIDHWRLGTPRAATRAYDRNV